MLLEETLGQPQEGVGLGFGVWGLPFRVEGLGFRGEGGVGEGGGGGGGFRIKRVSGCRFRGFLCFWLFRVALVFEGKPKT